MTVDHFDIFVETLVSTVVIFAGLWTALEGHVRRKTLNGLPTDVRELRVRVESLQSENAQLKKERDEALKNALPPPKPPGYEVIKLCDMIHIKCPRCSSETRVPWRKTYENQHRNICITCPICETNWTLAQCRVKEPT